MDPDAGSGRTARVLARRWLLITLAVALLGLLNFSIAMTAEYADHGKIDARKVLLWEMTGAACFLMVLPILLRCMAHLPVERHTLGRRLPLLAGVFAVCSAAQTLLMWGSRTLLYRLLGWGTYNYGVMRYRFLMEGGKLFLAYSGVLLFVTALAYARRSREQELGASRLAQQLTDARLAALKMQLNPHFLFNTLNMISSHVHDDPDTADAMIGHLSDFLRETLRHSDAQEVPLEAEVGLLHAYLAIMKARFEDRLRVTVEIDADTLDALVPHLILQPLVENAVTHCMKDPTRQGRIRLAACRDGQRLGLVVEDNGPGLEGEPDAALGRGVGLSNTAKRLRHLHGTDQRLVLANLPQGGLRVALDLPFRPARPGGPR